MKFLYNILIFKASLLLPFFALFNKKIALFLAGRKETFQKLSAINKEDKNIWFHAASLGEFEQAIPVIEKLKKDDINYKIVVTFFSPSGYENRKEYPLADVICYLPIDSKSNAKEFLEKVNPTIAIFIKYEFWPNLLNELKKRKIVTLLISGILRKNQLFFRWYGGFMRDSLSAFDHFFVQDANSKKLLQSLDFNHITISGDTRFDRVINILKQKEQLPFITEFKNNQYTVVAGSTWKEDEVFLINYINKQSSEDEKFIIIPHNIQQQSILKLSKSIHKKTVLFSEKNNKKLSEYQVFIIDTMGFLSKIYASANIAYVGGGLKTGLHNILEPATFGIPIVIGNNYHKFKEAVDLVSLKGCISISNQKEFSSIFTKLKNNKITGKEMGKINNRYIDKNLGATQLIMNYIKTKI